MPVRALIPLALKPSDERGLIDNLMVAADSVAASSYQMHEVFQGYRQSGDFASKRRVREATNAALSNLPDWPTPTF